jgi:hypothetical protein
LTQQLEADSVVLRDPQGRVDFAVLEQGYRTDTVSEELLLSLYEGQVMDFTVRQPDGSQAVVKGKLLRSGYVPSSGNENLFGDQYRRYGGYREAPLVEVDGKLQFSLPGTPVYPALPDDAILKPRLLWSIAVAAPTRCNAELSYVTGGLTWLASYNLVAPETGDTVDLVGWVTIGNESGKSFADAVTKLMAGDVSKLKPGYQAGSVDIALEMAASAARGSSLPQVTEKAFDEFHLYSLPRPLTLRHHETKQVEFVRARGILAAPIYVYSGADIGYYGGWNQQTIRNNPEYGTRCNTKVWAMREFLNTQANGLGIALPKGRVRFYRRDDADGRIEFTGENAIDHTPKDEKVRVYTGNTFDVVGERKRTDEKHAANLMEEEFEIRVRNHKTTEIAVRVAERLYRGGNWEVLRSSHAYGKTDAQGIEFTIAGPPDGEVVVTYRVRYRW